MQLPLITMSRLYLASNRAGTFAAPDTGMMNFASTVIEGMEYERSTSRCCLSLDTAPRSKRRASLVFD